MILVQCVKTTYSYNFDKGDQAVDFEGDRKDPGCEDRLPSVMKKNSACKRFKLTCKKLRNRCTTLLGHAIGSSKKAKKCKAALKGKVNIRVKSFCTYTCKTCGKLILN